jgi:hypothetical protein
MKTSTLPSNYTDAEIFALLELQLGKPPVTTRQSRQRGDDAEGRYYNDLTEWLFRLIDRNAEGALLRVRQLRSEFYHRYEIIAFDATTLPERDILKYRQDGSVEFDSPGFDNQKRLK